MTRTTDLPPWSFDMAHFIAQSRMGRFGNRFRSQKLRGLHRGQAYFNHSESIIGYLGDIGAAKLFGTDPVEMFGEMIDATDGLAHRDQFDLFFNGYHIDAKIEDYGDFHEEVLLGERGPTEAYGNRLINADQWEENHGFTDIYLFGCFDPPMGEGRLIHQLRRIRWVGYATAKQVEDAISSGFVPHGPRLPMRAKIIPHGDLNPVDDLFVMTPGNRKPAGTKKRPASESKIAERIASLQQSIAEIATG